MIERELLEEFIDRLVVLENFQDDGNGVWQGY